MKNYADYLQEPNVHFYRLNSLAIEKDTLRDIEFAMHTIRNKKTKIYWTSISLENIRYEDLYEKLPGFYESLLFKVLQVPLSHWGLRANSHNKYP